MVRHGFTLIEMLAVIAILVVVTAISLPVVEDRLAEARFDAAVRRVDAGMAWARAESQRRGEALRVEVRASSGGMGLFLAPLEQAGASVASPGPSPGSGSEKATTAAQPFVSVEQGLTVSDRDPSANLGEGASGEPTGKPMEKPALAVRGPDAAADAGEPLIVATFLPDGSAMAAGPFYVSGYARAASLAVNHWTGGVRIRLLDLSGAKDTSREGVPPAQPGSTGESGANQP
jgi:prepilin-type N-terminal cleavage/methylation domain-containing protein